MDYKKDDSFYKMSVMCHNSLETAKRLLSRQIEKDFPVGTKLIVVLGGAVIKSEVVDSNTAWWCTPDRFVVKNIKTGKNRNVTLGDIRCKCDDDWNQITD